AVRDWRLWCLMPATITTTSQLEGWVWWVFRAAEKGRGACVVDARRARWGRSDSIDDVRRRREHREAGTSRRSRAGVRILGLANVDADFCIDPGMGVGDHCRVDGKVIR